MEPLRVNPHNPRYFSDGNGKAIYLTGSHTWSSLQDIDTTDPPSAFDYQGYLDFLKRYQHNFIRLWTWELTTFRYSSDEPLRYASPFPWKRTGPGTALDGKPKFDLTKFDEEYFDRLRSRTMAAMNRGIYVSIMLFEGHGMFFSEPPWCWEGHPFHVKNNINGIDGDPHGEGRGLASHTLRHHSIFKRLIRRLPATAKVQEEYVKKVIDTVNDLDNVLYEISNEDHSGSVEWQYHMIDLVHSYEKEKPKQHPVGMTTHVRMGNDAVFRSRAEWISPTLLSWPGEDDPYKIDPPRNDGKKVILSDTDHLWGMGGDRKWVWKSFLRGYHTVYMDRIASYENGLISSDVSNPDAEDARRAMGHTLIYADKMNLAAMTPRDELSSTTYCLADPGREYLVYQTESDTPFHLYLKAGAYRYEWFNPDKGTIVSTGSSIFPQDRSTSFAPPFPGDAVLYVHVPDDR